MTYNNINTCTHEANGREDGTFIKGRQLWWIISIHLVSSWIKVKPKTSQFWNILSQRLGLIFLPCTSCKPGWELCCCAVGRQWGAESSRFLVRPLCFVLIMWWQRRESAVTSRLLWASLLLEWVFAPPRNPPEAAGNDGWEQVAAPCEGAEVSLGFVWDAAWDKQAN